MGILDNLFNKDNNDKQIEELNETIKAKDKEIKELNEEIKRMRETYMSGKQVELFERNLKSTREQNAKLKKENEELSKKIKNDSYTLDDFIYRLPIIDFFTGAKFKEIREFLEEQNIEFIQDFDKVMESPEIKKIKNYQEALEKYDGFKNRNEVIFENRVALCKGEKVSKIFKKSRKFLNYLADRNIEFMDDMKDLDFDALPVKGGFAELMVKELKNITEDYFKVHKI